MSKAYRIQNRRYIGNKRKLLTWIFSIINKECPNAKIFADIFAGTGVVSAYASAHYDKVIINDFLHSNHAIYKAFFEPGAFDGEKIAKIIDDYNSIEIYKENYISKHFGGKYFSQKDARTIGYIREDIERNKDKLRAKEYYILLASLMYSMDKIANTVGHYDAYFKKSSIEDSFYMQAIAPLSTKAKIEIHQEDANELVKTIKTDIAYINPPYNTKQYSRFYHLLETLTKWDKPKLYGVALKPSMENMSEYSKVKAKDSLQELIQNIDASYLVLSYNNSSNNQIDLKQIEEVLKTRGKTKAYEQTHQYFSVGKKDVRLHREFLFLTKLQT